MAARNGGTAMVRLLLDSSTSIQAISVPAGPTDMVLMFNLSKPRAQFDRHGYA